MHGHLTDTVRELMRTLARPFDPYRPELHYMRGPGPKCLAKRDGAAAASPPAAGKAAPTSTEIAQARA